jgi:uncharacterized protein (DUF1697 family)
MPSVGFLRGVNVGGHRKFQPSVLVKELAHLDAVNVGAAGTFVIRAAISPTKLREEFLRRLPFEPDLMICRGRELLDLAAAEPFAKGQKNPEATRYVTVMAKRPKALPELPLLKPDGDDWQVRVIRVIGPFALSLHRRMGKRLIYPNEVVEKHFGVAATTRNWNTVEAICDILNTRA